MSTKTRKVYEVPLWALDAIRQELTMLAESHHPDSLVKVEVTLRAAIKAVTIEEPKL